MADRTCAGCDSVIVPHQRERHIRKWCSEACRSRYVRATRPEVRARLAERARERARAAESLKPPKPRCANCGVELSSRRKNWTHCAAPACQSVRVSRLTRDGAPCSVDGCEQVVQGRGLCSTHYVGWWRSENPEKRRDHDARRRARKSGATVGVVDSLAVMERDKWLCHLCGKKIPKDARWPDRLSASVDHVVPLAQGGEHSMANVRASHAICNMRKSAFGGGEQLALLG